MDGIHNLKGSVLCGMIFSKTILARGEKIINFEVRVELRMYESLHHFTRNGEERYWSQFRGGCRVGDYRNRDDGSKLPVIRENILNYRQAYKMCKLYPQYTQRFLQKFGWDIRNARGFEYINFLDFPRDLLRGDNMKREFVSNHRGD